MDNELMNEMEMLEEIYKIGEKLYSGMGSGKSEGHKEVFDNLTELGRALVGADRASFWKWDKKNHELWTTSATDVDKIVIPEDKGLVGKALKEKRVIVTNSPYNEPEFDSSVDRQTGYITFSVLVMPVADINGEYIGAFQIINKMGANGFDEVEDVRKLSLAAFICGMALESETFFEDSQFDKLTSIKNRMGMYNDLSHKYANLVKSTAYRKMSFFICDIDKYKKINDNHGHNIGDAVLVNVAEILSQNCKNDDTVYRWGGDEFIMIMPDADLEICKARAETIRATISETQFKGNVLPVNITMSFGCVQYDVTKTIEENIAIADDNLFSAKDSGRNCVYG